MRPAPNRRLKLTRLKLLSGNGTESFQGYSAVLWRKEPAERKNLEFLIGLRNKIEHRHLPELDTALYGERQAALLNLEELIVQQFGQKYGLAEQLAVSLQFSQVVPDEKVKAIKTLTASATRSVKEYVEKFRAGLPAETLNSMKYSFSVFLVPKVANRATMSDVAVQFVKVDEASADELNRLEKLNVLVKEKHIPIANLDLYKPGEVVEELNKRLATPSVFTCTPVPGGTMALGHRRGTIIQSALGQSIASMTMSMKITCTRRPGLRCSQGTWRSQRFSRRLFRKRRMVVHSASNKPPTADAEPVPKK